MKSVTVRLPDQLVSEIEAESRQRNRAKSDIIRERLQRGVCSNQDSSALLATISDLIGSVDGLPPDLSANKKRYLKSAGYGQKRNR